MNIKINSFVFCSLFLLCLVTGISAQNNVCSNSNKDFEIVRNKIHKGGESGIHSRNIFGYVKEELFNPENVSKIFDQCQKKYPEPYILTITLFSDKKMLQKLINFENQNVYVDFSDSDEGKEAARKYYEKVYPKPTGYFRASYSRYGKYEFFDYSPDKNSFEKIKIDLKLQD